MPTEPGTYELRYVANQDRTVLASRVIEVVATSPRR
jgi:Ca-activated chloride channel family protein